MSSTSGPADRLSDGPPAPTAFVEGHVGVDHGRFVVEVRGLDQPSHLLPDEPGWAAADADTIIVQLSSEWTKAAAVRLEAWPREPACSGPPGSEAMTVAASFARREVGARGFSAPGLETGLLDLASPGSYEVRICRWGGDQVDAIFGANPDDMIHRVENFLLQFWPSVTDAGQAVPADETSANPPGDTFAAYEEIRRWAQDA